MAQRAGLAVVAAAQLAITVPLLILGHDHDAGAHAAHELGSFDLALAIAFAVGAIRPALSAGLAWPCAIAAAGLAGTAIADLIGGQTIGADEAQHLIAVAGAILLYLAGTDGTAPGQRQAGALAGERGAGAARRAQSPPGRTAVVPGGGEIGAGTVPGVAARRQGQRAGADGHGARRHGRRRRR